LKHAVQPLKQPVHALRGNAFSYGTPAGVVQAGYNIARYADFCNAHQFPLRSFLYCISSESKLPDKHQQSSSLRARETKRITACHQRLSQPRYLPRTTGYLINNPFLTPEKLRRWILYLARALVRMQYRITCLIALFSTSIWTAS
jgi:hypothetical protein